MKGIVATPRSTDGLSLEVIYSNAVINAAEVNVMLDHFEAALLFLVHRPHDAVGDVNLVNENERRHLVTDLNPGDLLSPAQNISELIEAQASHTPEKIAVRDVLVSLSIECHLIMYTQLQFDQDIFMTYREMDNLSNHLARILITSGIKRGTLVALYMEKSIEMFLSILAIHKAGGGYVPLDPDHPAERTQTIVCLAQTVMVLTTREFQGQLAPALLGTGVGSMLVDFKGLSHATKPDVGSIGRNDICHVLFTSGSTGTPKGIAFSPSILKLN